MEGNIYCIGCRKTGKKYIGSTILTIERRLIVHKSAFNNFKKNGFNPNNYSSFEVLEENDYYIELIETITFSSRTELLKVERKHIEKNDCVNKLLPYATDEERKIKDKLWFDKHKEEKREYDKKYREDNKEKLDETYLCECGSTCLKRHKMRHEETSKHQEFLATNVIITRKPILLKELKKDIENKYYCECCKNYYYLKYKLTHERSQKHILNMAVLTDQDAKSENK